MVQHLINIVCGEGVRCPAGSARVLSGHPGWLLRTGMGFFGSSHHFSLPVVGAPAPCVACPKESEVSTICMSQRLAGDTQGLTCPSNHTDGTNVCQGGSHDARPRAPRRAGPDPARG